MYGSDFSSEIWNFRAKSELKVHLANTCLGILNISPAPLLSAKHATILEIENKQLIQLAELPPEPPGEPSELRYRLVAANCREDFRIATIFLKSSKFAFFWGFRWSELDIELIEASKRSDCVERCFVEGFQWFFSLRISSTTTHYFELTHNFSWTQSVVETSAKLNFRCIDLISFCKVAHLSYCIAFALDFRIWNGSRHTERENNTET